MTFKGRLIANDGANGEPDKRVNTGDQVAKYARTTDSILTFQSTIAKYKNKPLTVEFKAFLTEMSDNFQSSWETEEVYGRMDPIGTFKNTKRTISVGWTIPAANQEEAESNLDAIRSLTAMLYPGYSAGQVEVTTGNDTQTFTTANSMSKPPLIRLSYANLIQSANGGGLLGWVDGFNVQPNLEMGFFIYNKFQFPKVYTMSCTFNVLHEHDLGWNSDGNWIGNNPNKFPFGGQE
jgi:hypothetical protein